MKIALGCDHGGYELKEYIKGVLDKLGHTYEDFGCHSLDSCDYPDFALPPPVRWRRANATGASWCAPPVSASPLPPTRSRASAVPTAPTLWRRR